MAVALSGPPSCCSAAPSAALCCPPLPSASLSASQFVAVSLFSRQNWTGTHFHFSSVEESNRADRIKRACSSREHRKRSYVLPNIDVRHSSPTKSTNPNNNTQHPTALVRTSTLEALDNPRRRHHPRAPSPPFLLFRLSPQPPNPLPQSLSPSLYLRLHLRNPYLTCRCTICPARCHRSLSLLPLEPTSNPTMLEHRLCDDVSSPIFATGAALTTLL